MSDKKKERHLLCSWSDKNPEKKKSPLFRLQEECSKAASLSSVKIFILIP